MEQPGPARRKLMRKLLRDEFFRSAEPHTAATHDGISRACMKKSFIPSPGKRHVKTAEHRFV